MCEPCADFLPLHPRRCPVCANPALDVQGCGECRRRPPAFDTVMALGAYRRALRAAIRLMKFQSRWDLAFPLAARLAATGRPDVDLLVPMPLHRERARERGFDQALLLAQILSRHWQVPWRPCLQRVRATQPQALLPRRQRLINVAEAFAAARSLGGAGRIGLVDDVLTSGATAQAAATTLRQAGAQEVHVIVLARALPSPWERG